MTARTTQDSCPYLSEADVIEDQECMAWVLPEDREELGVAITMAVADLAPDSLAHWLTTDEANFPVEDDSDTWGYDAAVMAWQSFIETGKSGTDWFRSSYRPVVAE